MTFNQGACKGWIVIDKGLIYATAKKRIDDMLRLGIGTWAVIFCLSISIPFSFPGEIYRWTDEKGVVHFTDDISNVPARYRNQVDKREVTEEISKEAEKQIVPGRGAEVSIETTKPPVKPEEKPDRVREYLKTIEEKIEAKRMIEKKISELEEEMKAAEKRIKQLEKEEEENYPSIQPQRIRGRFVPVESPHYREKVKLVNRIKSIKEEIATLEERLSNIRRGL
jgi:flagellar motility protein MotE (MotC chaperone)